MIDSRCWLIVDNLHQPYKPSAHVRERVTILVCLSVNQSFCHTTKSVSRRLQCPVNSTKHQNVALENLGCMIVSSSPTVFMCFFASGDSFGLLSGLPECLEFILVR